ncbi:MAG: tyrosine-type recombinase/integrase [Lachnospiraceae bacterium]|nr:tyrosine-type recombinase/integrase [Lachnospiraceae bacterium]
MGANESKEIVEIAKRYDGGWLFPQEPGRWKTRYVGNRIRSQQLRRRMKEICEEIGITYKPPHKIRKTYASILRENNVDEQTILDQMGHTTISTTEQHYFRSRRRAAERSKQLGEIGELAALTK